MSVGQALRIGVGASIWGLFMVFWFGPLVGQFVPGFEKTWHEFLFPPAVIELHHQIWAFIKENIYPLLWWGMIGYLYPVVKVEHFVFEEGLGIPLNKIANGVPPFDYFWLQFAFAVYMVVLPFIFWSTLYVRTAHFTGLWNPFWNVRGRKRGIALRALSRVSEWWQMMRHFGTSRTGNWAPLMEVVSHRYCEDDIFFGRPKLSLGGMMRPVGFKTEKHMVTIAGTGSGKSTAALIPNLCLHEGSLLCIDPKGELARITAERRGQGVDRAGKKGLGQDVFIVDPFKIVCEYSSCYNPFDEMARVAYYDGDRAVTYSEKIAEALVKISGLETYWDIAAKRFLQGLILYVFAFEPEEKRNLLRLRELVMQGDVEGFEEAVGAGVIERGQVNAFDFLLEKMKVVKNDGPYGGVISNAAYSVLTMGDNQSGSIITTAQEHTSFLDNPEIAKVCGESHFLLDDYKYKWQSIYLVMPVNMMKGSAGGFLRMFVLLFIDMMMRNEKPDNPPILLAIDEFPNLGSLAGIEVVAPMLRSYGVRFWAVGQDIEQFQATYPETWTGFIGGAGAVQFMGITHPSTVELMVRLLGTHLVSRKGFSYEAPLLDSEQVPRFLAKQHKNQVIWFGQQRPMKLKICPYFEYLPWWYYAADPRYREKFNRKFWRFLFGRRK